MDDQEAILGGQNLIRLQGKLAPSLDPSFRHQAMTEVLVETGGNLRGGEAPDMQFEPSGEAPLEIMLVRKSVREVETVEGEIRRCEEKLPTYPQNGSSAVRLGGLGAGLSYCPSAFVVRGLDPSLSSGSVPPSMTRGPIFYQAGGC